MTKFTEALTALIDARIKRANLSGMVLDTEIANVLYKVVFNNGISLEIGMSDQSFDLYIDFADSAKAVNLPSPYFYQNEDQLERKAERVYDILDANTRLVTQSQYNFLADMIALWITQTESLISKKGK